MGIRKKANGRWEVRYAEASGKNRYETVATRDEAKAVLAARTIAIRGGTFQRHDLTLNELSELFTRERIDKGIRPSTARDYRKNLSIHILPALGVRKLRTLTVDEVSALVAAIRDRVKVEKGSAGTRTANKCLLILRSMLKLGEGAGYITMNVAEHVRRYRVEGKNDEEPDELSILSPSELKRLIAAADGPYQLIIETLAMTGLRTGEALGLTWGDVELGSGKLFVRRALCSVTRTLAELKTRRSRRAIDMPPELIKHLREWKLRCPKSDWNLVFPSHLGHPRSDRDFRMQGFYPALRRAGLRHINVHSLRHGVVSMLIAMGEDVVKVRRHLGHASPQVTLSTYSHLFERREERGSGAKLGEFIDREASGCETVVSVTSRRATA